MLFAQRRTISTPSPFPLVAPLPEHKNVVQASLRDIPVVHQKQTTTSNVNNGGQQFQSAQFKPVDASIVPGVGFVAGRVATITNAFNQQARAYIDTIATEQTRLMQSNDAFLARVYASKPNPTIRDLRNYGDWTATKRLVVRDELMKVQIGGKTNLPLTDAQYSDLAQRLDGLDLSNMNDPQVTAIIQDLLHPNEQIYIDALKTFKTTGKADSCFQTAKLEQLQEYLENVDINKITAKEFKYIEDNFIEKTEIHHRTSVSSDPTQQSNIDNLDTLNTTKHKAKHTDPETGKIDYRRKLSETPLDRKAELEAMNEKRVLNERLAGLGIAVAIGLGTGFALGFIVSLAQNGINAESIKYAFVSGAKQAASSAVMAAGGYAIGSTVGAVAGKALTECVKSFLGTNVAAETVKKIGEVCNMGAAGALVTIAFSVYEFAKLKRAGYSTKECLLRVGKSAALSLSILIISMVAVWVGCPGIAVSIVAGIVMIGYSVIKIKHDKKVAKDVTLYSIELCRPALMPA